MSREFDDVGRGRNGTWHATAAAVREDHPDAVSIPFSATERVTLDEEKTRAVVHGRELSQSRIRGPVELIDDTVGVCMSSKSQIILIRVLPMNAGHIHTGIDQHNLYDEIERLKILPKKVGG